MSKLNPRAFGIAGTPTALALALAIGCASATPHESLMDPPSASQGGKQTGSRSSHLTSSELQGITAVSTLDAVRKLRPEFLRASPRSVSGIGPAAPSVYVNGLYTGDPSWLNMIPLIEIRDIIFLNPVEARLRLGSQCPCGSGVLLVSTRRERIQ